MGCFAFLEELFSCYKNKSPKLNKPHQATFSLSPEPRPTLTGDEILKQLRQDGIVPEKFASGGVSFSVPVQDGVIPRRKPPRRLERVKGQSHLAALGLNEYSSEERQIMADVYRYDRYVEQAEKKALERDYKRFDVKKERERREFMKKMFTQQKLYQREEKLKRLEEERTAKWKGKMAVKKYVEQAEKKALERDYKRFDVKERERRRFMKKRFTQQKLYQREEKLKRLDEERTAKRKGKKVVKK